MNKKYGLKNFSYGILAQVVTIGLGVIIPRLVLVNLGSEANGLLSSIGNILGYMSLLEAGVGTATLNALYKPIGQNDHNSVNRIMAATNKFYKRTGKIYLVLVVILSVVFTLFIDSSLPRLTIFIVVILSGLSGVISYFFQGKFNILLSAEGKGYVTTNITTIISTLTSVGKIVLLVNGFDVIALQLLYFGLNLLQMVIIVVYIKKKYKWIDLKVEPDYEAISQKKAVLVHQISSLVFSNTDVLVLTIITSLKQVSVYSMYAMIFGMVKSIVVVIVYSYVYSLGQSYSDKKRFLKMYDTFEVYSLAISSAAFCITGILLTPFLKLYTAGVNDITYVDKYLPWLFVVFYLLHNGRTSSANLINIAQEFENTKWRAILESIINIVASIVLTIFFGVYGVVLGTIAALLYRTNDMIIYSGKILKRSCLVTYKRWLINVALVAVISFICMRFNFDLSNYGYLVIYGIALLVVILPIFIIVNSLLEKDCAKYAKNVVKSILKTRFSKS